MKNYILVWHEPKVADLMEWAEWFETADRKVAHTKIGDVNISTVFLWLDHNSWQGEPLLFETMIFGGEHDDYQERYSTWEQAEKWHKEAVKLVTK